MGHGDTLLVADGNYPADSHGTHLISLPGTTSPNVLEAIRSIIPADEHEGPSISLMGSGSAELLPVQKELLIAGAVGQDRYEVLERHEFYERARSAYLIIRTGEARTYANALLRKGVIAPFSGDLTPAEGVAP
jgi:L-fucose mutarotase